MQRFVATICVLLTSLVALAADPAADQSARELAKEYSRLKQARYYRHGSVVFDNAVKYAQMDESRMAFGDLFLRAYYEGRWAEFRELLAKMPEDVAASLYDRILEDLTGRNVPVISLDDVMGLIDACPGELRTSRLRSLGQLLRVAVPKEQEVWLRRTLEKGSRRLGKGGDKKLVTGRILLHANFADLAREYLPTVAEATEIVDVEIRDELLKFLASQEELEEFQQTQLAKVWKQKAEVLANAQASTNERQQAADRLAELLGRAAPGAAEPWIRDLMRDELTGGLWLTTALGKLAQAKGSDPDVGMRANNLRAQKALLLAAAKHTDLSKSPWAQAAAAMADWWIREVDYSVDEHPTRRTARQAKAHVLAGDLLDTAPDGAWLKALPTSLRERADLAVARAVLISDRFDQSVNLIVEIAKRNRAAGASLAEEYLKQWAHRHNPDVPEDIRKKHQLPDDARIMVTPIMMEKNIDGLAKMMDTFRTNKVEPKNGESVVNAFDVCYSKAEVYRREHIERVFGPASDIDEEVFLHMIRTMVKGLGSNWRKMEVQKESGTRRSQQETLRMVRDGYRTAVEMIEERAKKHPDAWRNLMLAGSLLSDWANYEYYQELGAASPTERMEAFREKSNQAEQCFIRASEAYARQVPKLERGRYTIELYLAWFHSLLGINTNGDLNLSKPLDRRALGKLREQIRGLPGGAAKAHVDKLAKYVTARMEDTEKPLHEELKYKFLAGSLVITKESPFSFEANSKVNYYDELLSEIRLETRVDGPTTIHRDQSFGIILTVHHTEAVGRMADFGKYLANEAPPPPLPWQVKKPTTPPINTYRAGVSRGRRDDLERNIREALSLFFDIKTITFSPRDVQPRATERPGWKETVLAYVHAKAKDASVDKIPRVQMSLAFLDLTGPVSISIESPETMIRMTEQTTPPRPCRRLDVTEVFDPRNMANTDEALLEISATANGLVPELADLVDLDALGKQLPIARVDPHEGVVIKELNSWTDQVHAVSQRRWTVAFDAAELLKRGERIELKLPAITGADAATKHQAYVDMDLVDLDEPVVLVGTADGAKRSIQEAQNPWLLYGSLGGAAVVVLLLGVVLVRVVRGDGERPLRARDVFHMPAEVDPFVVVQLLRRLNASSLVRLNETQRQQMGNDIVRIERTCFSNGSSLSEDELRDVARKWLRAAC